MFIFLVLLLIYSLYLNCGWCVIVWNCAEGFVLMMIYISRDISICIVVFVVVWITFTMMDCIGVKIYCVMYTSDVISTWIVNWDHYNCVGGFISMMMYTSRVILTWVVNVYVLYRNMLCPVYKSCHLDVNCKSWSFFVEKSWFVFGRYRIDVWWFGCFVIFTTHVMLTLIVNDVNCMMNGWRVCIWKIRIACMSFFYVFYMSCQIHMDCIILFLWFKCIYVMLCLWIQCVGLCFILTIDVGLTWLVTLYFLNNWSIVSFSLDRFGQYDIPRKKVRPCDGLHQ